MKVYQIALIPFSILYGLILAIRNWLFDFSVLKVKKIDVPIVSVGNLSVGGTGKSPHVQFLVEELSIDFSIAVLSRGYGRKTKGFLRVTPHSKAENVGDEPLNYAQLFGDKVEVAVCENRVEGVRQLLENNPNLDLIILDDAFQHRFIHRDIDVLLTEYHRPFYKDFVLPSGRLREFSSGKNRADVVVATKCPFDLTTEQKDEFKQRLNLKNKKPVFFSSFDYTEISSLADGSSIEKPKNILLVTGIGNPKPLIDYLSQFATVQTILYNDHYQYTFKDIHRIHNIFDNFVGLDKIILTTEKDAVKIRSTEFHPLVNTYPWFVQKVSVVMENKQGFLRIIYGIIKKNKRVG